jgi:hypothetical protein
MLQRRSSSISKTSQLERQRHYIAIPARRNPSGQHFVKNGQNI